MKTMSFRIRTSAAPVLLAATALAGSPALAGTATTTMTTTATIPNSCSATTTTNLAFGSLAARLSVVQTDQTGTISVTCLNGGTYTIIADTGLYASSGQRQMSKNGATGPFLTYNLYSDSGRTTAYPTTTAASATFTGTGTGSGNAIAYTIYGRIPAQTATAAGSYTDTVTFTVTY